MPKVCVCLADPAVQETVAMELRLKKHTVTAADPINPLENPKAAAKRMIDAKADVAVVDYIPDDAHSVKMLQAVTDGSRAPRFIFILPAAPAEADVSHVLMAVNEGAAAILRQPVNTEALANYIERAIAGPGRFRHEIAREAEAASELAKVEQHSRVIQTQIASLRKLVSYLLATPASSQHRAVMLVSDSAYQREQLKKTLEDHGFHVSTAERPTEAIEKALEEKPRIIISDLEMDGMNGVEFCHALKIEHKLIPCYFVICTANSEKIESVMAPGNGVDACVLKPASEHDTLELVTAAAMGLLV